MDRTDRDAPRLLTPGDVRRAEFDVTRLREGYDVDQVDRLLDDAAATIEALRERERRLAAAVPWSPSWTPMRDVERPIRIGGEGPEAAQRPDDPDGGEAGPRSGPRAARPSGGPRSGPSGNRGPWHGTA